MSNLKINAIRLNHKLDAWSKKEKYEAFNELMSKLAMSARLNELKKKVDDIEVFPDYLSTKD